MRMNCVPLFRLPEYPRDELPMDIFHFQIGGWVFFLVTAINMSSRAKPALSKIFRIHSADLLDADRAKANFRLIKEIETYHPRNLAVGPEFGGARWIWIADHGADEPPFPGHWSPLYQVFEDGSVITHDDPLLRDKKFSFDGAIWANPKDRTHWLVQANIGTTQPRLLRWDGGTGSLEDVSASLPEGWRDARQKFLITRRFEKETEGARLYLGADTSGPSAHPFAEDRIMRFDSFGNHVERETVHLPERLCDSS